MEKLQFIVREVNKLLNTSYNMLSFDALKTDQLLQVLCDVLQAVGAEIKVTIADQDLSQVTFAILSALQSIKYVPVDITNPNVFCAGVTAGDVNVIYPTLEWLVVNQIKIKKRAYLARYVDKMPIPAEAAEDPEVMSTYKNYEKVIDDFWGTYKENSASRKDAIVAVDLQNDIKKMHQDINNVNQRSQTQWEKIMNLPNKENLIIAGKLYRSACTEQRNLTKQIAENVELITNLEFQVKNLEDKWLRRGRQSLSNAANLFEMIEEEAHVNKIFLDTQLPQELERRKELMSVMEKTVIPSCPSRENLKRIISRTKDEVQRLVNEKLTLYANTTDDKLAHFRKQVTAIVQKKVEFSNEVSEIKNKTALIDNKIREMEMVLFNAVGGEILHGEELKHFIAMLREKSVLYKQLRVQLQSFSTELGIENRSSDVLKNIDSSIDDALLNQNPNRAKEQPQSEFSSSLGEAKQICKGFMQDVDILKGDISKTHEQLVSAKKESETITQNLDQVKDVFENTMRVALKEVERLKEKVRQTENDIDLLENTWKSAAQALDKLEYIFNRLLDEMISDYDDAACGSDTYLATLMKKKEEMERVAEEARISVEKVEQIKRREQETVEFFKHTEYIILQKMEEDVE